MLAFAIAFAHPALASDGRYSTAQMMLAGIVGTGLVIGIGSLIAFNKSHRSHHEPDLVWVSVVPSVSSLPSSTTYIKKGDELQLTATGTYSDGSTKDITNLATWSSSNTDVASVNSAGLATALTEGRATITASLGAISSNILTLIVLPTAVFIGNTQGLVYSDNMALQGSMQSTLGTIVNSVATDTNGNVYAGTADGNVWKHAAGAADKDPWVKLVGNNVSLSVLTTDSPVKSVATDTSGNIYAGTENGAVWKYTIGELGNSWAQLGSAQAKSVISIVTCGSENIYILTAANDSHIYKLNVNSWELLGNNTNVKSLAIDSSGCVYCGTTTGGVWKYNTSSWQPVGGVNHFGTSTTVSSLTVGSNGVIYCGTTNDSGASGKGRVYKYVASSSAWMRLGATPKTGLDDGNVSSLSTATDINGSVSVCAGTFNKNVWRYTAADEWVQLGSTFSPNTINSLATDSSGGVYIGVSCSVWKFTPTIPGATWQQLGSCSIDGSAIVSVATNSSGDIYIGTYNGNVWKYTTIAGWKQLVGTSPDDSKVNSVAVNSTNSTEVVYVGTNDGNVFKYTDSSWGSKLGSLADGAVNSLAIDVDGAIYAGTAGGQVYLYNETENSWSALGEADGEKEEALLADGAVNSVAIDENGAIYAGTAGGHVYLYNKMTKSWSPLGGSANPLDGSAVLSVATETRVGNVSVCAGTQNGNVWRYTTSGGTWINLSPAPTQLDGGPINSVATDSSGAVYAGTKRGNVFVYSDEQWDNLGYGSGTSINSIAVF